MSESFIYRTDALVLSIALFVLMLAALFSGLQVGKAKHRKAADDNSANSTVVASLFGLLGFLLAFTFGMSGSRYDSRGEAIVREANSIGTAIMRSDLYPDSVRTLFRAHFKAYLEARIAYHESGRDTEKASNAGLQADSQGTALWRLASTLARDKENLISSNQMIPALNDMLDSATLRNTGERARVPDSIVAMLFILSLASAFYVGYSSAGKGKLDGFIVTGFCLLTAIVIYITLDLDRPRRGLIKVDSSHQAMLDLRKL